MGEQTERDRETEETVETLASQLRRLARSGEFPYAKSQELLRLADEIERTKPW